jgi:hypothetical protein
VIKQDDELDRLEESIRILKNKYDQFFGGRSKLPPSHERRVLEVAIHELSAKKIRDNARRFRLNTLLSRYNQFREMWARKTREIEEGPLDFRRRQAAMSEPEPPPPPPPPVTAARRTVTSSRPDPYVRVEESPSTEAIRRLYDQIEKEHLKLGRLPPMNMEQLGDMISRQSGTLRARYNVDTIAFRVETVDGKVRLKAKPLQD